MHRLGVGLPVLRVTAAGGLLQGHHHVRVVHVVLAAVHVLEHPADLRRAQFIPGIGLQVARVAVQALEAGAAHARGRAREAQLHHFRRQADDLEQLRAAVAGDGGDAHLGDDLGQALVDALAVAAADLGDLALLQLQDAAPAHVEQGLVGQVGIHRGGAETEQAGDMVRIAGGAGLDDQVGVTAQPDPAQVVVDGAGGQQRMHHRPPRQRVAVGDQQHHHAFAHGLLGLPADALDPGLQPFVHLVGQVDQPVLVRVLRHHHHLPQLALRQHRRVEQDVVHRFRAGMEDVGLPAQLGGQRHHAVFAQRIDRRVGDLGEGLAEVVVQRPVAPAQHRHRGVVAHRAGGFLLGLGHRPQHQLHFLGAELE